MSIEALNWALAVPLGGNAKVILIGLANHAHPDGTESYPALDRLASYAHCDRSTARRNVRKLVADGWAIEDGLGPKGQTKYRLPLDREPDRRGGKTPPSQNATGGTGAPEGVAPMPPEPSLEPSKGEKAARAKAKIPEDFPPSLRPHLERVYVILRAVAQERPNTPAIVPMALARVLMARPHKCLVKEAHDYAAWCAEKGYPHRNIVSGYRNRLDNSPTIAGVEVMPEREQPGQASANVTPIRGGRYDARAAKADREASREAAARRLLAQQQPSA